MRYLLTGCFIFSLTISLTACGSEDDAEVVPVDFSPKKPMVSTTDAPAADVEHFTSGAMRFGLDLYRQLKGHPGNLVLSPYGIHSSLAVLTCGMNEEAKTKARKALRTDMPDLLFERAASTVVHHLFESNGFSNDVYVGNALWLSQDLTFQSAFLNKAQMSFGEQTYASDFAGEHGKVVDDINAWMSQQSGGEVKQVVSKDTMSSDTVLAATNVVSFRADWHDAFIRSKTKDIDFSVSESKTTKTAMMHRTGSMAYGESDAWQLVSLPYRGGTYRMDILLPKKRHELTALIATLDTQTLNSLLRPTTYRDVALWLPRFSFESRLTITEALKAMNFQDLFAPSIDLFTQLIEQSNVPIALSSLVTTARVEVTEDGVKAASGSAAMVSKDGPPSRKLETKPTAVRCDHPFLFMIYHVETKAVLFIGRVADPS